MLISTNGRIYRSRIIEGGRGGREVVGGRRGREVGGRRGRWEVGIIVIQKKIC